MKKAVIYARVSSKEQEREGFSIPAQLKLLQEYALRNNFSVLHQFIDIETAKTSGRQNFDQMVRFFTKNRDCRAVLVERPIACTAISGTRSRWRILTWRSIWSKKARSFPVKPSPKPN
jgi:predicted site-specific integrase-resolvase